MSYLRLIGNGIYYERYKYKTSWDYNLDEIGLKICNKSETLLNDPLFANWRLSFDIQERFNLDFKSDLRLLQFISEKRNALTFNRLEGIGNFLRDFPIIEVEGILYFTSLYKIDHIFASHIYCVSLTPV
jgi:hypothetical protein